MRKVESVVFMFKDYESIEIPAKYIGSIFIGDIQNNIERITLDTIQEKSTCKEFYIEVFGEFNGEYDSLYNISIFERFMKSRDIVTLELKYDDGSSQYLSLPYRGERENQWQAVWISKLGNAYICISERKCLEDFISEKDANNQVLVNLRKNSAIKPREKKEKEEDEIWLL